MTEFETTHDTFSIESSYQCAPAEVFSAFADIELKKRWYAESRAHDILEYGLDFAVGGKEVLAVRMSPSTPVAGAELKWSSDYSEIKPENRIVFHQNLAMNGRCISCAVITVEFTPTEMGCDLRLTHQAVFFEGSDGPEMRKMGWQALLAGLQVALSAK